MAITSSPVAASASAKRSVNEFGFLAEKKDKFSVQESAGDHVESNKIDLNARNIPGSTLDGCVGFKG